MLTCANCGKSIPEGKGVAGSLRTAITGFATENDTVYCSNRCKNEAKGGGSSGGGKGGLAKKALKGVLGFKGLLGG